MSYPLNGLGVHFDVCHLLDILVSQPKGSIGSHSCHDPSHSMTKGGLCNVQSRILRTKPFSTVLIIIISPLHSHWTQNGQHILVPIFFKFKHLPLFRT